MSMEIVLVVFGILIFATVIIESLIEAYLIKVGLQEVREEVLQEAKEDE
ncbi:MULTISPECIES: hypothetical protein [unclassified Archaeoglobus]|nr:MULTISPECIES: hypothetical protein [unclassified Archaeoglobus]